VEVNVMAKKRKLRKGDYFLGFGFLGSLTLLSGIIVWSVLV